MRGEKRTLRICPRCRKRAMKPTGEVKAGPRGGRRKVVACRNCGYRRIV